MKNHKINLRGIAKYYDNQTEDEALAEDEEIYSHPAYATMLIPVGLVPCVRSLVARYEIVQPIVRSYCEIFNKLRLRDMSAHKSI